MKLSIIILLGVIYLILTDWGGQEKLFQNPLKMINFQITLKF